MSIISINQEILNIINEHNLQERDRELRKKCTISDPKEWQEQLDDIEKENRLLKIGIVGRVKAGKSSLLNALLFNGKNILPKAATPMTAALTIIEYADELSAEVDFFTSDDIAKLEKYHQIYEQKYEKLLEENYKKEVEKKHKKKEKESSSRWYNPWYTLGSLTQKEEEECKLNAAKITERQMREEPYTASYQHYEKICSFNISQQELEENRIIREDTYEKLMQKLIQYIGADGRFMPYTKSLTLRIPEKSLKGIQIIDTPGLNDPIQSRSTRTEQFLAMCDAVLVVSPAGQFLSEADIDLLAQLTITEGIQEIFLVASQTDTQLYGQEYEEFSLPSQIYDNISLQLHEQAKKILKVKSKNRVLVSGIDDIISKNKVICTSGMCYTLYNNFESKKFDQEQQHNYQLLRNRFPRLDNPTEMNKELSKLANIDTLHNIIENVKKEKSKIISEKKLKFEQGKKKALSEYLNSWIEDREAFRKKIENEDIKTIHEQLDIIQSHKNKLYEAASFCFKREYDYYINASYKELMSKLDEYKMSFKKQLDESRKYEIESYRVENPDRVFYKPWNYILLDKYITKEREVMKVSSTVVKQELARFLSKIYSDFGNIISKQNDDFHNKIVKGTNDLVIECMESDKEKLDPKEIKRILYEVLNRLMDNKISIGKYDIPSNISNNSGMLRGYDAEKFLENVKEYIGNIDLELIKVIETYTEKLNEFFQKYDFADKLTNSLIKDLDDFANSLNDKEATLFEQNTILNKLNQLRGK